MSISIKPCLPILAIGLLLSSEAAEAFRCKSKLVTDGMHEQEVIAICGPPTTRRNLGLALRSYDAGWRHGHYGIFRGRAQLTEEVIVTEYVYNFGPRKLMRRLLFEGGVLVEIESLGYGYNEHNPD